MLKTAAVLLEKVKGTTQVEAHCDGPCGVYDPASARIAAVSMWPHS